MWPQRLAVIGATLSAFCLYLATAAPGLTWAHHGADGGELLTAAVTNGVPHPPGYPLYMMLLQGWLWAMAHLLPSSDLAWQGNLFSACCAAVSVGITVQVVAGLLPMADDQKNVALWRWGWAFLVGMAWAVAPLAWSQALITEVYALHMIFLALLGWVTVTPAVSPRWLIPVIAVGVAHHLTFVLLLPAVLYYFWFARASTNETATLFTKQRWLYFGYMVLGVGLGLLFHLRTPYAAGSLAPINWGYPDNWEGFWWLVSGAAYRSYLFGAPTSTLLTRVAAWAGTITQQFTPVGLAILLIGLSYWDRHRPQLRNWSLLWLTPISVYAINYYTRDSEIYLLPVIWLTVLWLGVGLVTLCQWLATEGLVLWQRFGRGKQSPSQRKSRSSTATDNSNIGREVAISLPMRIQVIMAILVVLGMCVLIVWRWPTVSARHDLRAQIFLQETSAVLESDSIVLTSADAETFTLWYGAWGSGELLEAHPDLVLLNYALYQFPWYRRLVAQQYPEVVGQSNSIEEILALNADRSVFFSEQFSFWPAEEMVAVGPIWRYVPQD